MRISSLAFISLFLTVGTSTANAEPCREPKLETLAEAHPECRFYKGTRHYRAKEYSAALALWLAIVESKDIPKELEYLRIDAQNNVGFMYYMGLGAKRDEQRAIEQYWLPAEKAGHEEAAYHLCHAYADAKPKIALSYCREALRRYKKLGQADGESKVIAAIQRYISRLEAR